MKKLSSISKLKSFFSFYSRLGFCVQQEEEEDLLLSSCQSSLRPRGLVGGIAHAPRGQLGSFFSSLPASSFILSSWGHTQCVAALMEICCIHYHQKKKKRKEENKRDRLPVCFRWPAQIETQSAPRETSSEKETNVHTVYTS